MRFFQRFLVGWWGAGTRVIGPAGPPGLVTALDFAVGLATGSDYPTGAVSFRELPAGAVSFGELS